MISLFIISFLVSLVVTLLIVKSVHLYPHLLDSHLDGIQKVHRDPVPRIGGFGIYIAILIAAIYQLFIGKFDDFFLLKLLVVVTPIFLAGLFEDVLKNVSPIRRIIFTVISAAVGYYWLNIQVIRVDIPMLDTWLNFWWISLPITLFAITGVTNAINIIDGFNGLASIVVCFMLLSVCYVAFKVGDVMVLQAALVGIGAICGFFIWNYPHGLIFLGDSGAYLIGIFLANLVVLLVMRNPIISAWYPLLLLIYPVFETFFSIYRRMFIRKISPSLPDGVHLHMLIFRRLVRWAVGSQDAKQLTKRNSLTAPYLWLLSVLAVAPATLFWNSKWILLSFVLLFIGTYRLIYWRIVKFKSPKWLIVSKKV